MADAITTATNAASSVAANMADLTKKNVAESVSAGINGATVNTTASQLADGVSSQRSSNSLFSAASKNSMGKDQFLKLLVTQLQYQDPLNPQDNQAFSAQLAQFSALEETQNMEKALTALSANIEAMMGKSNASTAELSEAAQAIKDSVATQTLGTWSLNNTMAVGLIGKNVRMNVNEVAVTTTGQSHDLNLHVEGPAQDINVLIKDQAGNVLRNFKPTTDMYLTGGDQVITWDGMDANGEYVAKGNYTVEVTSTMAGKATTSYVYMESTVKGLSYTADGGIVLDLGGQYLPVSSVVAITGNNS